MSIDKRPKETHVRTALYVSQGELFRFSEMSVK